MIIINTRELKDPSLPKREIDTLKTQDLTHLMQAAANQEPLRIDTSGHFYRLYKPQGTSSPIIRLVNLVIKLIKERSFSAFHSQDQAISEKALSILDKIQNRYSQLLENIPTWKLTTSDQEKLDAIRDKKKKLTRQHEKRLEAIRLNLEQQLTRDLENFKITIQSKVSECRQENQNQRTTIQQLIALKKQKEANSFGTPFDYLQSLIIGLDTDQMENCSVHELTTYIQTLRKNAKSYRSSALNSLNKLKEQQKQLPLQMKITYREQVAALQDKYLLQMGDLSQEERNIIKESRELFKKQNISKVQKDLLSFRIALDSISKISFTQKIQNTFTTRVAAIQAQAHYLHTMAEHAIDKTITLIDAPPKKSFEGSEIEKLDQIRERLKTIKEELHTKISLPQGSKERALSFTSEVKNHINALNLLQKENPQLKRKITEIRKLIATQIAIMPRIDLEFGEIYPII